MFGGFLSHWILLFLMKICLFFSVLVIKCWIKNSFAFLVVNLIHPIIYFINFDLIFHSIKERLQLSIFNFIVINLKNTQQLFHGHAKYRPLQQLLQFYLDPYLVRQDDQYFIQYQPGSFLTSSCLNCTYRHILLIKYHLFVFLTEKLGYLNSLLVNLNNYTW